MIDYATAWNRWFPLIECAAGGLSLRMLESAGIGSGHRVLDLATGIGEPALTAARRVGPEGRVLGVDISAQMIGLARARAEAARLTNTEFKIMDIDTLAVSESFDAVLCRWGLMFVNDLGGVLGRAHAGLLPGGRLSVSVWASADEAPTLSLAERVAHRALGLPPPDEGVDTPFALCDVDALAATLAGAGFDEVAMQPVPVVFVLESSEDYVAYRRELSVRFAAATAGQSENDQRAVEEAVARAVEAYRDHTGVIRMENRVYCISATRQ